MMHDLPLLINISVAVVVAFVGGLIARRLGLPTIVGYLLAGILIGPFTPGFVGDTDTISQLAELGVIFLMFGVGIHFSLHDLWRVRRVAVPGALGQTALSALVGVAITQLWGWSIGASLVLGLAISVASTVVLLRGLMDNGLLNTPHGQAAVGWLVMEDLLTVLILLLLPTLGGQTGSSIWVDLGLTLLKAAIFAVLALFVGARVIPWLLLRIAHSRSRELFILAVLAISLGTALGAAEIFGVSLALGAFVAGVVVSESPLSHQVGADVLPFREAFAVLFFVSIGMLANPSYLLANITQVLLLTVLIMIGKPLIVMLLGLIFPWPALTTLVVSAGLSQIGEFSFILGQAGVAIGLLDRDQYSLILAGSLLSMMVNPFMYRLIPVVERRMRAMPRLWKLLDRHGPTPAALPEGITGHVVIIGDGRVGAYIVNLLSKLELPQIVVESDAGLIDALNQAGVPSLYGDAANSEVLSHAHLDHARALVITIADESSTALIVATARDLAPELPILARAASQDGVQHLAEMGAQTVIHPEMEGGLEIVRHLLLQLGFPLRQVFEYTQAVRRDHYNLTVTTEEEHRLLRELVEAAGSLEIAWLKIPPEGPLVGQTLAEANLRARTGASVVALVRDRELLANPKASTVFQPNDRIGLIGTDTQFACAEKLVMLPETDQLECEEPRLKEPIAGAA